MNTNTRSGQLLRHALHGNDENASMIHNRHQARHEAYHLTCRSLSSGTGYKSLGSFRTLSNGSVNVGDFKPLGHLVVKRLSWMSILLQWGGAATVLEWNGNNSTWDGLLRDNIKFRLQWVAAPPLDR